MNCHLRRWLRVSRTVTNPALACSSWYSACRGSAEKATRSEEDIERDEIDPLSALEKVAARRRRDMEEDIAPGSGDKEIKAARKRRSASRRKTVDNILGDVLNDALRLRDLGKKPSVDFIYKRTQERLYEEEYGKKPPSAKEHAARYIPFPPDFHLHRLLPLYPLSAPSSGYAYVHRLLADDPWPARAITPSNPVWTKGQVEDDKCKTNGEKLREWETEMFSPRVGYDEVGEFLDASDELAHWECELLNFLRTVPLTQRRSLPYLHEWYRLLVHRVIRAERRYTRTRDAALAKAKASSNLFKRTEDRIDRIRAVYAEAHRSLSTANWNPEKMKKSTLAPFMKMSDAQFLEWREVERQRRNILVAELS